MTIAQDIVLFCNTCCNFTGRGWSDYLTYWLGISSYVMYKKQKYPLCIFRWHFILWLVRKCNRAKPTRYMFSAIVCSKSRGVGSYVKLGGQVVKWRATAVAVTLPNHLLRPWNYLVNNFLNFYLPKSCFRILISI